MLPTPLCLSELTPSSRFSVSDSILDVYENSEGSLYCLKKVENSLASDRFSFLTTLKHPCLLKYYHLTDQQNGEIAEEYCPFGSLSDLIQAQHKFSANDLWCILTQLVYLFDFLSKKSLTVYDLSPSDVFLSSINPIAIKVSLLSSTQHFNSDLEGGVIVHPYDGLVLELILMDTIKDFFDVFIDLSTGLFIDGNADLLIDELNCSGGLDGFVEKIPKLNCVEGPFSIITAKIDVPVKKTTPLSLSTTLLFHVFQQRILMLEKPVLQFCINQNLLKYGHNESSIFATKIINVSTLFRHLFIRAFDFSCMKSGQFLEYNKGSTHNFGCDFLLRTCCVIHDSLHLTNILSKWYAKYPITAVFTDSLHAISFNLFNFSNVTRLELRDSRVDLSFLSKFPQLNSLNILHFFISDDEKLSCLCDCHELKSLGLTAHRRLKYDLTRISRLHQLTSLSLRNFVLFDLSPLSSLRHLNSLSFESSWSMRLRSLEKLPCLSFLDLRETRIPRNYERIFNTRIQVEQLFSFLKNHIHLDLSRSCYGVQLSRYIKHRNLSSLSLAYCSVPNIHLVASFKVLERLDLSFVNEFDSTKTRLADISFVSSCTKLKYLSLDGYKIDDLTPLSSLENLISLSLRDSVIANLLPLQHLANLSYLDLRKSLVSKEFRTLIRGRSKVKKVVLCCVTTI
ncbi:hypothetical protein RCL1_007572 [Eukaryota sp. TZLM3-RCL]